MPLLSSASSRRSSFVVPFIACAVLIALVFIVSPACGYAPPIHCLEYERALRPLHAQLHFQLFQAAADIGLDPIARDERNKEIDAVKYDFETTHKRFRVLCGGGGGGGGQERT
jgi:hypothetical protein